MSSPLHSLKTGSRSPLPQFRAGQRWTAENKPPELNAKIVKEYLAQFPKVFEEFAMEAVSISRLEKILAIKREEASLPVETKPAPAIRLPCTLYSVIGIDELCQRIVSCEKDPEIYTQLHEISSVFANAIHADYFTMYVIQSGTKLAIFDPNNRKSKMRLVGPIGKKMTLSAHVAFERKSINVYDLSQDVRFPNGLGSNNMEPFSAMCIPIVNQSGESFAIIEYSRKWEHDSFTNHEFELINATFSWITACVQKIRMNKILRAHSNLNDFLLDTTKELFGHVDNIDRLVRKIMIFTKNLVQADRCSLFLVDSDRHELFADYFDEGRKDATGTPLISKDSQIRFPDDKGIAGHVLQTGESVNIIDAYEDSRFNKDVDLKTGYHTRNILCMPIKGKEGVIGIVQMINKIDGEYFTKEDMNTFQMFAVYCALALYYSQVYNMLTHQQTKYRVAMEVLQFHIRCSEEDVASLMANPHLEDADVPETFDSFDFCCYDYDEILTKLFLRMIFDNFGESMFEMEKLCRFVLTVRKNYRPVTYHNWQHGFHVAHCLWQILKCSEGIFTNLEKIALLISGICHDLDHRGYSNDFFRKLKLPLAALYSTSVMEQHHYKQTITILHSEGHDIFSFLTSTQHKQLLGMIQKNIIATDLSLYFGNQSNLLVLIEDNSYDENEPEHKEMLMALMMTAADLCAVPKPWDTQQRTVSYIYEEFYRQGDEEKKRGIEPQAMMDRNNKSEIPKQQVGFISYICQPLYSTLAVLLPNTKHLMETCNHIKEQWEIEATVTETRKATIKTTAVA